MYKNVGKFTQITKISEKNGHGVFVPDFLTVNTFSVHFLTLFHFDQGIIRHFSSPKKKFLDILPIVES